MDTVIGGWFDTRERPRVRARLFVPRFGVSGRIDFLVDTGATVTTLHPDDGRRIGCPFDELREPFALVGVGGRSAYYREPALIVLAGSRGDYTFDITLMIAKPEPPSASNPRPVVNRLPSLLGRDVLNQVQMDYDFPAGRLNFFSVERLSPS